MTRSALDAARRRAESGAQGRRHGVPLCSVLASRTRGGKCAPEQRWLTQLLPDGDVGIYFVHTLEV